MIELWIHSKKKTKNNKAEQHITGVCRELHENKGPWLTVSQCQGHLATLKHFQHIDFKFFWVTSVKPEVLIWTYNVAEFFPSSKDCWFFSHVHSISIIEYDFDLRWSLPSLSRVRVRNEGEMSSPAILSIRAVAVAHYSPDVASCSTDELMFAGQMTNQAPSHSQQNTALGQSKYYSSDETF